MSRRVEECLSHCSVVVIDDEVKHRDHLEYVLSPRYKVTCFSSGLEALGSIQKGEFDLVMLDIKMPVMDGYEVIQMMQERHLIENTSVVFGAGKTRFNQIVKGLDKGAVDYLQKPYVAGIVLARVTKQLQRKIELQYAKEAIAS